MVRLLSVRGRTIMKKVFRRKRKGSLFRHYFGASVLVVVAAFMFLGFIMLLFNAAQWWQDKTDSLSRNVHNIAMNYADLETSDYTDSEKEELLFNALEFTYKATLSEYFVSDIEGNVLYCFDSNTVTPPLCDEHRTMHISEENIRRAIDGGYTDYTTGDEFGMGKFVVAEPIVVGSKTIGMVFASEDAVRGFLPYVSDIAKALSYAICFVLVVVFIMIYFVTRGIAKPLEEMQEVTEYYSRGEFQHKANENYKKRDFSDFAKALNKMGSELAVTEESRKSFVANVSHELKTPMTSIVGFVDGILDGTIPPEEEKKYLSIVSNEAKRLSRMVVSMLNLSKIEAGEVQLSPKIYDVSSQIFETLLNFEKRIDEKKINIEGFEEMGTVRLRGDRDLIQQVIYNLFDNAVKFTPENGTIWVFAENDGHNTTVRIRNSGAGVKQEEISRIFERFYKVDKSRSFDTKGVGLGLYIVKTIINMHGGEITAGSKKDEYTEFRFEIPFEEGF